MTKFDQSDFEDEAWSTPGVVGIVVAIALLIGVVVVGSFLEANPNASNGLDSILRVIRG